jgi:hypothetical protein
MVTNRKDGATTRWSCVPGAPPVAIVEDCGWAMGASSFNYFTLLTTEGGGGGGVKKPKPVKVRELD